MFGLKSTIKLWKWRAIFFLLLFFPISVSAAEIFIEGGNEQKIPNRAFNVDIFVDTKGEDLNAFSGDVYFSQDSLDFEDIRLGGSIINLWVEEPKINDDKISFSGIIPGGFNGEKGFLMTLIFKTKNEGSAFVAARDFEAFRNDGQGTKVNSSYENFYFYISENAEREAVKVKLVDLERPEAFQPMITKMPGIADDKYALLFFTQDKNSGMDYFEVKEGFGLYKKVTSPYILDRQELDVDIYIRAVDKASNIRLEVIKATNSSPWYKKINFYVIIYTVIAIVILAAFTRRVKIKWIKSKQK